LDSLDSMHSNNTDIITYGVTCTVDMASALEYREVQLTLQQSADSPNAYIRGLSAVSNKPCTPVPYSRTSKSRQAHRTRGSGSLPVGFDSMGKLGSFSYDYPRIWRELELSYPLYPPGSLCVCELRQFYWRCPGADIISRVITDHTYGKQWADYVHWTEDPTIY
jgi:hypothetical protein